MASHHDPCAYCGSRPIVVNNTLSCPLCEGEDHLSTHWDAKQRMARLKRIYGIADRLQRVFDLPPSTILSIATLQYLDEVYHDRTMR